MKKEKLKFHEGFLHPEFNHIKWYIRYDDDFYDASLDEFEGQEHKAYWLKNLIIKIENECWNKMDYGHYTEKSFENTKQHTLKILKQKIDFLEQSLKLNPKENTLTTINSRQDELKLSILCDRLKDEEFIPIDTDKDLFINAFSNIPIDEFGTKKIIWKETLASFIFIFLGFSISNSYSHKGFIYADKWYIKRILLVIDFVKYKKEITNKFFSTQLDKVSDQTSIRDFDKVLRILNKGSR